MHFFMLRRISAIGMSLRQIAGSTGTSSSRQVPGSSYRESFNGKPRDACLNGEIFYSRIPFAVW